MTMTTRLIRFTQRARAEPKCRINALMGLLYDPEGGNIARKYEGMMIAVGAKQWVIFHTMPLTQFVEVLLQLAANVKLFKFRKHRRGPKKPRPKRNKYPHQPHVSTARLLAGK
jgi:hypothetical protein